MLKLPLQDLKHLAVDVTGEGGDARTPLELVRLITGWDLAAIRTAELAAKASGPHIVTLPDGTRLPREDLRKESCDYLKELVRKYQLGSAGSKTKKDLLDMIETACRLSAEEAADYVTKFTASTKTFPAKRKEEHMPRLVNDYKRNFNWQDRFDHYFSSIDSGIDMKSKITRMFVCAFQMCLVNAWTIYAELQCRKCYPGQDGRRAYVRDISASARNKPDVKWPIKDYLRALGEEMIESPTWFAEADRRGAVEGM